MCILLIGKTESFRALTTNVCKRDVVIIYLFQSMFDGGISLVFLNDWLIFIVPSFTGIMFQDITTLLLDPKAFKDTIDLFVERYKGKNISIVAGMCCWFTALFRFHRFCF